MPMESTPKKVPKRLPGKRSAVLAVMRRPRTAQITPRKQVRNQRNHARSGRNSPNNRDQVSEAG
jgi:hypothetical protein